MLRESKGNDFRIVCIEGSPTVFKKLETRVMRETLLADRVTLVHGLVGQRAGTGNLVEKAFHAMNRVDVLATSKENSIPVPYIDLSEQLAELPDIDLLKCDIEGSELAFWEHYPEIFHRVPHAVFELHNYHGDDQRCWEILKI